MKNNIVLVGFMGAGKTTVARMLAARLKRPMYSTDEAIVEKDGRPITDIFKIEGEPFFRRLERAAVRKIAEKENIIVDCGGGVVLDPENLNDLKNKGVVFFLAASPDKIYERIKKQKHRPLLNTTNPLAKIEELLEKRQAFYDQADHMINTNDNDWQRICEEIEAIMKGDP